MAIEIIHNQPVLFRPSGWVEPCPCDDCEDCMTVQDNDYVYFQLIMNPCGDELICGQPVIGPELLTNGNFTTNLDDWTTVTWTWSSGKACNTGGGNIGQVIAGNLVDGDSYQVSFTISDYVAGDLTPALGGTSGSPYTANGDYSVVIVAGAIDEALIFSASVDFEGCLDNVSLRKLPDCWTEEYAGDSPFIYSEDGVCVNGTGNLFTDALANNPGYFVASFTISNYVSGTVQVSGACTDTWVGGPFSSNGEKFAYGVFAATGGVLCFEFTDFIGCISDVHLNTLFIPQISIINKDTNAQSLILNDGIYFTISGNSITWKFKMSDLELDHGCYMFCVTDICGVEENNLVENGGFDVNLDGWTAGEGWTNDGEGHAVYLSETQVNDPISQQFTDPAEPKKICAKIEVIAIGTNQSVIFRVLANGVPTGEQIGIGQPGIYAFCGTGDTIQLTTAQATSITIDNIIVRETFDCEECNAFDYCSNCINFVEEVTDCTLLIEGYNNENSFGFTFVNAAGTNIFKLSHRIASELWNPQYPEESNDYTFSDGTTKDTFAQSDKFWQLGIKMESGSERAHDVIRLQKRSDHLIITDVNESREFWAEKGDYNPDWVANKCKAPSSFKVKLKTSTLYNNLCSE